MTAITTVEEFKRTVADIEKTEGYRKPIGFGIARVQFGQKTKQPLTMNFAHLNWGDNYGSAAVLHAVMGATGGRMPSDEASFVYPVDSVFVDQALEYFAPYLPETVMGGEKHRNIQVLQSLSRELSAQDGAYPVDSPFHLVMLYEDKPVQTIYESYIKLYALSLGKAPVNSLALKPGDLMPTLPNVVWAGNMAYEREWLDENEIALRMTGEMPHITRIDKLPAMLDHVLPHPSVRILFSEGVRLGAQLGAGTTMMSAAAANFNSGTKGPAMIEGRISQGVFVGEGSDLGGGASTLGTMSGGNGIVVRVGDKSLVGANAVAGIPLGDGCIIDAGVSILGGTPVRVTAGEFNKIVHANPDHVIKNAIPGEDGLYRLKGLDFANTNGVHFRRDEDLHFITASRSKREVVLNEALHGAPATPGPGK